MTVQEANENNTDRLTSIDKQYAREMICRYEDCDVLEEHCPHCMEADCECLQAIIKKLAEYEDLGTVEELKEAREKQQKTDWIPVEKELPKKHDDYFVTYKEISNRKVRYYTGFAWFRPQTKEWYGNVSIPNLERDVIAWQEKPKPYKRMTKREGKCAFEEKFPRGDAYLCKKTALLCSSEKLKFCKYKQPYKKEGAE